MPYGILIKAHLTGWGPNFPYKKCSLENVTDSVQISSSQLLLSKRDSNLKSPTGIPQIPIGNLLLQNGLEYPLLRSNCGFDIWTLSLTFSGEHFLLGKLAHKVCSN